MADSPDLMHIATIGSRVGMTQAMRHRVPAEELVRRYGMWVHRCVSLNAQTAASVPCRLYMVDPAGTMMEAGAKPLGHGAKAFIRGDQSVAPSPSAKAAMRGYEDNLVEITDHPVLDLLQNVNKWTEGYGYRESLYSDLQIYGRSFSLVVGADEPEAIWRMLPHKMRVLPDPTEFIAGFEYGDGADRVLYEPEDVLWFRLFDPLNPWEGMGPLEAWIKTIDAMYHIAGFQDELFKRGGAPDFIVKSKRPISENEKRSFRRQFREAFGRLFGKRETVGFVAGEDVEFERLTQTNRELEFSESQNQIRDMIGQAFGVPKPLLTADDVNRSNAKEAADSHMRHTIWPMVQRVEDVLNEQLVSRWDERLFLMHENPIRSDKADEVADRASKLSSGWSINEVRIAAGDEPIDDELADVPLVGNTYQSLERAIDGPDLGGLLGGGGTDDDDDDGDEPDAPDGDTPDDDAVADTEIRHVRLVHPVMLNGHAGCGCGSAKSQREMWLKADASNKPQEIDGPSERLSRELRTWFLERVDDAANQLEGKVRLPGVDVVTPDADRAAEEAAVARLSRPMVTEATDTAGKKAASEVGISWDLDNARVQAFLDDQTRVIGRAATDAYRREIRDILLDATSEGLDVAEVTRRIRESTLIEPWKSERIATTEIGFASTAARDQAYMQSEVVIGKEWLLSDDACDLCVAMASEFNARSLRPGEPFLKVGNGSTFSWEENGKPRTVNIDYRDITGGDAHPYCRCTIIPVLADE